MANTLSHRGPDGLGVWVDPLPAVALGHTRLSIQDLSAAGSQPMASSCGRYVITYNGEIYNFPELRKELEARGHSFRGHSDTEVLLAAITEWGPRRTLDRLHGMFAFGLWDRKERTLTLVRDRVGKKPLFYGWCGHSFLFGSELKALRPHPDFDPEIDRNALSLLIQYSWIPAPFSIFLHIRKLPPGSLLTVSSDSICKPRQSMHYWSAREAAETGERRPFLGDIVEATEVLDDLLRQAVRSRMIADVDLGALLSGGIDSSSVVALMQHLSPNPVKTFTIGFEESEYNEAEHAKAVAKHLGTNHTELYVTPGETIQIIPSLPTVYDEPLADTSAVPTLVVSQLARKQVAVALSGDGGDELFAGYRRYGSTIKQWNRWQKYPLPMRRAAAAAMRWTSRRDWIWDAAGQVTTKNNRYKTNRFFSKLEKKANRLPASDPVDLFARVSNCWPSPTEIVQGAKLTASTLTDPNERAGVAEPIQAMMHLDLVGFLADDILVKVDRASMAVGLEVRSPFLDHQLIEFAWSLPLPLRLGPRGGKRVLRRVLERYVPTTLTERPKQGFNIPISEWLCGPLREWADTLLDPARVAQEGLLNAAIVNQLWQQHLTGWGNRKNIIWSILMFQAWHEAWISSPAHPRQFRQPEIV